MQSDQFYLEMAVREAEEAFLKHTYPVGAVIVDPTGEVIGRGRNQVYSKGDFTSHAEVEAIRAARGRLMLAQNYENCTLYTTYEPCFMCFGAILRARIACVVWLSDDENFGVLRPLYDEDQFRKRDQDFYDYCSKYLTRFSVCKHKQLTVRRSRDEDLQAKMEELMLTWNEEKEQRQDLWRCGSVQGS